MRQLLFCAALALLACGDDDEAPAPGSFGAACANNEDCESDVCHPFMDGAKCTIACPANPDDCPDPSTGCNNMGVCKTK